MLNKSQIMKNAWTTYKNSKLNVYNNVTFAECLKMEWSIAKKEVMMEKETESFLNTIKDFSENEAKAEYKAWIKNVYKTLESLPDDEVLAYQTIIRAQKRAWNQILDLRLSIALIA